MQRLFGWSLLSGRSEAAGIFARRERGLQKVAYFVRARIAGDQRVPEPPSEEELEFIIMLVATAAFGYSTSREGLWGAFGKHANAERDLQFRRRLASLVVNLLGIQDPEDNEDDKDADNDADDEDDEDADDDADDEDADGEAPMEKLQ